MLRLIGNWHQHPTSIDPYAKQRLFRVDGELFTASAPRGPSWPMIIRPESDTDRTFWCRTIEWEDWKEAEILIKSR